VVAPVCDGLLAAHHGDWRLAATTLTDVLPGLPTVGGSAAQREVIGETLLICLVNAAQAGDGAALDRARALLDERLERRESPLDTRRRASLLAPAPTTVGL
jgi:hypothetical protein